MPVDSFDFEFAPAFRLLGLPFGVTPSTTSVEITDDTLVARFGPWRVRTSLHNIAGTETSGPYALIKTAGPAHLSFTDRGVTFATNRERGLCIRFVEPVRCLDPSGRLRHPGLTVTVADPERLAATLSDRQAEEQRLG
jgi:hypothetical protein